MRAWTVVVKMRQAQDDRRCCTVAPRGIVTVYGLLLLLLLLLRLLLLGNEKCIELVDVLLYIVYLYERKDKYGRGNKKQTETTAVVLTSARRNFDHIFFLLLQDHFYKVIEHFSLALFIICS